ncbi:c-type cytochrome [Humitalea sp. 24SJ18S-53]|uniref:c-type cytochrome n=1 Tax=Humitalea sp. 24SJ18S-53 TaxID=3422307 RepID=UPI003D66FD7F
MRLRTLGAALFGAALATTALAQDATRGATLAAESCVACHGANGRSQMPDIPSLAGQPADFITIQMILFRETLRHVPVMNAIAANLPDKDIEDMAAFFASLPPGPPDDRRPRDPALFAAGQALSGPRNCGVCHLPDYRGRNQIPRLTGQREDFLVRTMTEYRDGRRTGSDNSMNAVMQGTTAEQIAALAHYLSQLD